MKTVIEACEPRSSIIEGTFNPEIFTASLDPVVKYYQQRDSNAIDSIYTDAVAFFSEATYPTSGLTQTLRTVFARIAGDASVPSIQRLETSFGGGKTHTLIACTHIAYRGTDIRDVTHGIIEPELLPEPGTVRVMAAAGETLSVTRTAGDSIHPYTLWGEMAYQLGGEALYSEVRAEAESPAAPGISFFERVIGTGRVLIMLDELAQYATRFDKATEDGAEQVSAFLMSLNNYAKNHTGVAIIITLASASDAFGRTTERLTEELNKLAADNMTVEDTRVASERVHQGLISVASREATVVTPVQSTEIARILAKRLFARIDSTAAEETASAYSELYARNVSLLPEEAMSINMRGRIVDNYPFHPTFIDFLNNKLALAPNFQGTRGVLRVLAHTVRAIWQKNIEVPLIQVSNIDLRTPLIVDEILGRTGSSELKNVLNADIGSVSTGELDGGISQAQRADRKNPHPDGIPLYELTWKVVFLNSLVGRAAGKSSNVFGVNAADAILMTATPLLTPAQVNSALEEIPRSAFYLRCEDGKYFAHKDPTINSVLAQIRQNISSRDIEQQLKNETHSLVQSVRDFRVEDDVRRPEDIADNRDVPAVAVISLDAGEVDPMQLLQEKGSAAPREQQNMIVLLIPRTVRVRRDYDTENLFPSDDRIEASRQQVEDNARQVIAIQRLTADPGSYGIERTKLQDPAFIEMSSERELALHTRVAELYTGLYFAQGDSICYRELRASSDEGGISIMQQIVSQLTDAGKLLTTEKDSYRVSDLRGLAKQFMFKNADRMTVDTVLKSLRCYRSWPLVPTKKQLEQILREGVRAGCWVIYRMGDATDGYPEVIYTQEETVALDTDLLTGDYSVMPVDAAKKRGWLDRDKVRLEDIRDTVREALQSSGAATIGDLKEIVSCRYANATDEQVGSVVSDLITTSGYMGYHGEVSQPTAPTASETVSQLAANMGELEDSIVIITRAEQSERGWDAPAARGFLAGLTPGEKARRIFGRLNGLSGLYRRGKASVDIDSLRLSDLRLPSGATMHIDLENLTPADMLRLDELLGAIASVAQLTEYSEADIVLGAGAAENDALITELEKEN